MTESNDNKPLTAAKEDEIKHQINELLDRNGVTLSEKEWVINAFIALAEGANTKKLELLNEFWLAFWLEWQREDYRAGLLTPEQVEKLETLPGWSWETTDGTTTDEQDDTPCGCPECAAEAEDDPWGPGPFDLVLLLRELAEDGRLLVFDPNSKILLSNDDITGVCLNGSAVQITLRQGWSEHTAAREEVTA